MSEIAKLVSDAPPGEVDAVRKDIEEFAGSGAVARAVARELETANVAQLRVVDVDGRPTVLSKYNQLGPDTFFSHGESPVRFTVDHVTRRTTVEGPHKPAHSPAKLQREISAYAAHHYPTEHVAAVFAREDADDESDAFAVVIVGRRLSPQNFFNGQLTSQYTVSATRIEGSIAADVHYFEEGNVRLKSHAPVDAPVRDGVARAIEKAESDFERNLNKTLVGLNEREFKALRRQLPVTRQPMTWGKAIAGYKLGKELERD